MPSKLMYNLIIKQKINFKGIKMNFIAYFCKYNLKKFLIFTLEELIPKCLGEGIGVKDDFVKEKIKNIRVEGVSGSNSVKITLDGEGEMQSIEISDQMFKEQKSIVEDLIVAAHNDAKTKLKSKTK